MSRTKRYVPHYVIKSALHPWIDPETGEPYKWGTPERNQYHEQRDASRLRGDDGKNPTWKRNFWRNPMDSIRTDYRRLIAEGIEDHFDALEDEGWEFDWQGNQTNDDWHYEQMASEFEHQLYLDELAEEEAREAEYERREVEMDHYYRNDFDSFYDLPDDLY